MCLETHEMQDSAGLGDQTKSAKGQIGQGHIAAFGAPVRAMSADLFGQGHDDTCRAAQVAEPVDALVLGDLAE